MQWDDVTGAVRTVDTDRIGWPDMLPALEPVLVYRTREVFSLWLGMYVLFLSGNVSECAFRRSSVRSERPSLARLLSEGRS